MMTGKPLGILVLIWLVGTSGDSGLQWQKTVEGTDGDTVILPCSTKDKTDISHEEVEWVFQDRAAEIQIVHWHYQGEDHLRQQSANFTGRTSLFEEELSSGNCSLRLLVNTSHSGSYRCHVVIDGKPHDCRVNLKVLSKEEDSSGKRWDDPVSPDKPESTDGLTIDGAVGGVLGVAALIIIITVVVHLYRKRCRPQGEPNNPQSHQEVPLQAQQPPQNQENKLVDQNQNGEQNQMFENEDQDKPSADNRSRNPSFC